MCGSATAAQGGMAAAAPKIAQNAAQGVSRCEAQWMRASACKTLTYTQHTPTIVQSNLKCRRLRSFRRFSAIFRVLVTNAKHIVLLGYSLPPDDASVRLRRRAKPPAPRRKLG